MSVYNLFCYFSSLLAAFGFPDSSPPDNIILNPVNKEIGHILSDFQTVIGFAAHATLDIDNTRAALVDTIASLQGADGSIIAASEVHELLPKIHDMTFIQDSALCDGLVI